jgi:hypothetical protein
MGAMTLLRIGGPILLLLALAGYIAHLTNDRNGWRRTANAITAEAGKVAGLARKDGKPFEAKKHGIMLVRKVGEQRDGYLSDLNDHKAALLSQTQKVIDLGAETQRLRALSLQQAELVRKLTAQRDGWIKKAEQAATRTQRLSHEQEARQCEEAMDALYQAGF